MGAFEASITADQFLADTREVLAGSLARIKAFACSDSLKIAGTKPLVSQLASTQLHHSLTRADMQLTGHGKLDAFEQLMMERKALSEELVQLQELQGASSNQIKLMEAESLRRVQMEAADSFDHVYEAEQLLQRKVHDHVDQVRKQCNVLVNKRREIYNRQAAMTKLQQQRFEEVAQIASALAEKQMYIAAEMRRTKERQFQLQLSLTDLARIAETRSRPSSPQRSVVSGLTPHSPHGNAWNSTWGSQAAPLSVGAGFDISAHPSSMFGQSGERDHFAGTPPADIHQPQHRFSPAHMEQTAASPPPSAPLSQKSDSPVFEHLAPSWHQPVEPLGVRRSSAVGNSAQSPPETKMNTNKPNKRASAGKLSPTGPLAEEYIYGQQQQYPSAAMTTADPHWKRPFR